MARQRGSKRRPMSEINVVPYIDVMLVLLVIFMITAPMLSEGVKVDLPQASANPLPPRDKEPLVLSIDAKGRFYLNIAAKPKQPLAPELIRAQVEKVLSRSPDTPVMVKGDKRVDYGRIVQAMVLLQQAGAASVGMSSQPGNGDER